MIKYSLVLDENTSLKDVITALDAGGIGFLALVDVIGKLVGIITDGDLRRSILRNTTDLRSIINFTPTTMNSNTKRSAIIEQLRLLHRRHMPLVDSDNMLVNVFVLDELDTCSYKNYVVIMAGGLGTRLGELTNETPKPMLKIGDRPMLQHLIEQFRDQGFAKFIFCLNYKKEVIVDYFGDGKKFGVLIDYVVEPMRLGTAGALSLLKGFDLQQPFFVVNADVLTTLDFKALLDNHIQSNSVATMCVRSYDYAIPYGVVVSDKDKTITSIHEKPTYTFNVNAGIYVLQHSVLELIPNDTFYDMPTLFIQMTQMNIHAKIYEMNDYWVDIGKKEDLIKANNDLSLGKEGLI
ncbi:nucleotidyl transferase [Vibrio cholerae]|uniref:Nucleotidyl transferase n=2 Tax=Vibrio cholerae TaxID=666 RepID=A0A395U0P0_VIBCL|nr:nucleotidyltransferase family protein [Vibrio cholerae]EHS1093985.1 nucleotidyltransferase family protein [Vibrio cholerae]EJH6266684.1 nucleotidyltransferase family protein [Vibrio cholerae]EJL6306795.1 nucleotidyltransferase family protein [Vibrio cholerae]EJL6357511.1 nucleotidyltransferase family protein [Vibrio cholerae]EJL6420485.1 nucleotidyltransferase family protein [Vibrio cholerae]